MMLLWAETASRGRAWLFDNMENRLVWPSPPGARVVGLLATHRLRRSVSGRWERPWPLKKRRNSQPRHCEERRDEAIHAATASCGMDCFAFGSQ